MNSDNKENPEELFEKFLDSQQAGQAGEDIRKGEQIISQHPAPVPDAKLVADIKVEMAESLQRQKVRAHRRMVYKLVAAAAVIVLAGVSVKLSITTRNGPPKTFAMSEVMWESDDIVADDAELAVLTAEIEQIESEIMALQLADNGSNGYGAVTDLEIELVEINSDFWKG
jgi:hypothetical protein